MLMYAYADVCRRMDMGQEADARAAKEDAVAAERDLALWKV